MVMTSSSVIGMINTESCKSQLLQLFSEDKMTLGVIPGNYANILEIRVKR